MKRTYILLFLTLTNFLNLVAQESISKTEKLASLARVYGFLKYYHPEVAKGIYEWDDELIKQLPQVLDATDKQSLSAVYSKWIDSLGKVPPCKKCNSKGQYFEKNFDLSWIEDSKVFNMEVISKLQHIENNRNQKNNFYHLP